jgi:predicted nucleic acid-binding protein
MVVISDTSPLINLAIIGHLHLVPSLFGKVIMPDSVYQEIVVTGSGLPGSEEIRMADWVDVRSCKDLLFVNRLMEELDPGESEAIVLAVEIHANIILMDEDLGRKIALRYQLQPLGVLGILLKSKSAGMIPLVRPLMDALIHQAHFFIHPKLYQDVLDLSGE